MKSLPEVLHITQSVISNFWFFWKLSRITCSHLSKQAHRLKCFQPLHMKLTEQHKKANACYWSHNVVVSAHASDMKHCTWSWVVQIWVLSTTIANDFKEILYSAVLCHHVSGSKNYCVFVSVCAYYFHDLETSGGQEGIFRWWGKLRCRTETENKVR